MNLDNINTSDKILDALNTLINPETTIAEIDYCEFVDSLHKIIFNNFKLNDRDSDDFKFEYEYYLNILGQRLGKSLKNLYPQYLKNQKLLNIIEYVLLKEEYLNGRSGFLICLVENKIDSIFLNIIKSKSEYFNIDRNGFNTIQGLIKRKIGGFESAVQKMLKKAEKKDEKAFIKLCNKYLNESHKYKTT